MKLLHWLMNMGMVLAILFCIVWVVLIAIAIIALI